jgi:hypothetical protein
MPDFPIDPELAAMSHLLGGLSPAPAAVDRDRLLYEAGRRSVRSSRYWPAVAGMFAFVSVGLGVRLMTVTPRTEIVYVTKHGDAVASREGERPEADENPRAPGTDSTGSPRDVATAAPGYLGLRNQVVRFGAESLPETHDQSARRRSTDLPVEMMLEVPPGTLNDAQKSLWQHPLD